MVTVPAARAQATGVFRRRFGQWAADRAISSVGPVANAAVVVPLHPPTEAFTAANMTEVAAWSDSWREAQRHYPAARVTWEERRWAAIGRQVLPTRLTLDGPDAVAEFARVTALWEAAATRSAALVTALRVTAAAAATGTAAGTAAATATGTAAATATGTAAGTAAAAATGTAAAAATGTAAAAATGTAAALANDWATVLARLVPKIAELDAADAMRHLGMVQWLAEHPRSGLFVRQVPVRGVDTKWLERHRPLVQPLLAAATGHRDLGLRDKAAKQRTVRVRFLDPALAPGGLEDVTAPVESLAALAIAPRIVIGVENLETLLSLEPAPGVVAVWGAGYAYENLAALPWVHGARLLYWGDIDSHGFNILGRLRQSMPAAESMLMDLVTLTAHRDLCVTEPSPHRGSVPNLTDDEAAALASVRESGDLRLEQERIPWEVCRQALAAALGNGGE